MTEKISRSRAFIVIIIMALIFTTLTTSFKKDVYASSSTTVKFDIGAAGLNMSIEGDDFEKFSVKSDEDNIASFDALYTYLTEELNWGKERDTENPAPDIVVDEVTFRYEINYPNAKDAAERQELGGDPHYEGIAGEITLTHKESTDEAFNYKETIRLTPPNEIFFFAGYVYAVEAEEKEIQAGITVKTISDKGEEVVRVTDEHGQFSFMPDVTMSDRLDRKVIVEETESFKGTEKTIEEIIENGYGLELVPKFIAEEGTHYTIGEPSVDGYIKGAGKVSIEAKDGFLISLSETAGFSESLEVDVSEDGNLSPFYVQNEMGDISKAIKKTLKIDNSAPIITKIISFTAVNGNVNYKDDGMYANEDVTLEIDLSVSDGDGVGLKDIYLIGEDDDGNITRYEKEAVIEKDIISVRYSIPSGKEVLKEKLSVTAVDKLGNESLFTLVHSDEDKSTITIEKIAPEISPITIEGDMSKYGWYRDDVAIRFSAKDLESGIKSVYVDVNEENIIDKTYDTQETGELPFSFVITKDIFERQQNEQGTFLVKVTVKDNAGNVSTRTANIYADIEAPSIKLEGIEDGGIYGLPPTLTVTISERYFNAEGSGIYAEIYLDGEFLSEKEFLSVKSAYLKDDFIKDGTYEVKVYAVDAAENKSEEASITFIHDSKAPTISDIKIKGDASNGWYADDVRFTFESEDNNTGLKEVTAAINGKTVLSESFKRGEAKKERFNINLTKELISKLINGNGSYKLTVSVTDFAGNKEEKDIIVYADIAAPNVIIKGVKEDQSYKEAPEIKVTTDEKHFRENGAFIHIVVMLDGKKLSDEKYKSVNEVILGKNYGKDGRYKVSAYAVDAAGNKSKTRSISYYIDSKAPLVEDLKKDGDINKYGWYKNEAKFSFTVRDEVSGIAKVITKISGEEVLNKTFDGNNRDKKSFEFMLTEDLIQRLENNEGSYFITISAVDMAGNEKVESFSVKADIVKPVLNISLEPSEFAKDKRFYNYAPKVVTKSSEKYYFKEGAFITEKILLEGKEISSRKVDRVKEISSRAFPKDGKYEYFVYASDAAGNIADEKKVSFIKDTISPEIEISGVEEGEYYNVPKEVSIYVKEKYFDKTDVTIKAERSIEERTYPIPIDFEMTGENSRKTQVFDKTGTYIITVNSIDAAGNVAKEKKISFTVDTERPKLSFEGVEDGKTYGFSDNVSPQVVFEDSYLQDASVRVLRAGKDITSLVGLREEVGKITITNLPKKVEFDGNYVITAMVRDKAGNVAEKDISFTLNRFGSSFTYDDYLTEINGKYIKSVNSDLVITEKNLNDIVQQTVEITRDGELLDAAVSIKNTRENGYMIYRYSISKDLFEKEGVYKVNVITKDSVGNVQEAQALAGNIEISVDKTSPVIRVEGIDEDKINAENVEVFVSASDNLSPVSITIKVDGKEVEAEVLNGGVHRFILKEGLSQKVEILAVDAAGNVATVKETVSITKSAVVFFFIEYMWFILGGVLVVLGIIFFFFVKKKKTKGGSRQ